MSTLACDLVESLDPVAFARRLGMEPDPWQGAVLRSSAPRLVLNCHRQAGKSTVAAVAALHAALYDPGSLTLVFAPSQRQAVELFRVAARLYRALGRPIPSEAENSLSLVLESGSRIIALPADERTTRGYAAARLIILDEAARIPDELYQSIRPILAISGGRLMAMSTPFGKRGWFYRAATSEAGWERYQVTADECPRISAEFLDEERESLGDWMFRQEYGCCFVDSVSAFFSADDLARAVSGDVQPLDPGTRGAA